jgi:signal transduction histidine kinase
MSNPSSPPSGRVWQVLDAERARLAEQLQDGLAQPLRALAVRIQLLREDLEAVKAEIPHLDELGSLIRDLEDSLRHARALSHTLAPARLLSGGLQGALQELALSLPPQQRSQLQVRAGPAIVLPPERAIHAFQSAVALVRHVIGAPRAFVSLAVTYFDGRVRLCVDAARAGAFPAAEGLAPEIHERARELDATVEVAAAGEWVCLEFARGKA